MKQIGWVRSYQERASLDKEGGALPWISYPAIAFLQERVGAGFDVFEFGCGNSTRWWNDRVNSVSSVEHDIVWFDRVRKILPYHVNLVYIELQTDGLYSRAAVDSGRQYDLIVVDGRDRVNCIRHSVAALKMSGCIILDNSERKEYAIGVEFLVKQGFRQLRFVGLAPGLTNVSETTIYYREENCVGI